MMGLQFSVAKRQSRINKEWKIRLNENYFSTWIKNKSSYILLFNGATKGNPGKVGVGGVIKNLEGNIEHNYSWGLGHNTNTQAEALALLQGFKQLKKFDIKEVNVIGDSQTSIKILMDNTVPLDLRLARLVTRIKILVKSLQSLNFFHVLRENNKDADVEANKVALLSAGALLRDGNEGWDPIP